MGLAVGSAFIAAGLFVARPRADRVTKENFDRIRQDMALAEVKALFGPPGDYRTGPGETDELAHRFGALSPTFPWLPDDADGWTSAGIMGYPGRNDPAGHEVIHALWVGDTGRVEIRFDSDRVILFQFDARRKVPQGPLDQFRWRFGRYWRKWLPR